MLYTPPHFLGRRDLAAQLIGAHPFATLITPGTEAIVTHAPLLLVEEGESWRLLGHVARANPHWEAWEKTSTVLAIFNGGDAYISPALYTQRKAVPTWNYAVVHVHGQVELTHDSKRKEEVLKGLIAQHDPPYRARWDELDEDFREGMKRGIVAFSIAVERVDAKFKLSQNRPVEDRARVLQAMDEGGERARVLAHWTRKAGGGDA
ncbi:MAG TPA: FMN-binding negative transcriptional regulator [Burkholderiaceae bacterium]|nr:FMN-binding negative transcriptional regulator [Burkholderiaceae bacterium]